ncbi:MAG TPA: glycosyltransferase family 4 protein [Candidatus Nanoarchaeia archaeon]|nr:glycosyltransferase family 4 protein [Candidatus Nanoarchaeia archaeon]
MHIALLASGMSWGKKESLAITVRQYARELQRRGHTVAIISEKKGALSEEIEDGVPLFRSNGGSIFAYLFAFHRARKKLGRFDVVHGFSAAPLFVIRSLLCKMLEPRARIIHTLKSYSRSSFGNYFTWLLKFAQAVTVPTLVYKQKLRLLQNVSVIRSHLDISTFYSYPPKEKKSIRKILNLPDVPVLFYYGATWDEKGVDVLFQALRQLLDQSTQVFLLLVTRYEIEQPLKQQLLDLKLNNHVRVINEKITVCDYLNAVDVCVLPYKSLRGTEGNPSCVLESVACKTPVITTKLPELEEIFENGTDILLVQPNDAEQLAAGIKQLLDELSLGEQLAHHAWTRIADFDVKKITDEFLKLY